MTLQAINHPRRITSLFGTYLPPKKKTRAKKHLTVSFILLGTIPSKKNLMWAASNLFFLKKKLYLFHNVKKCVDFLCSKSGLKVFTQNSKKYTDWVQEQTPIIQEQAKVWHKKFKNQGMKIPLTHVSVKVYHYWKDNMERDLTNKLDSINDLLVSSGIVVNDSWQHIGQIHSEGENYSGEIVEAITRIDVTQSYFD